MQEVGCERVQQRAGQDPHLAQPGSPVRVARDGAGDDVTVPAEELRRAVQRQCRAVAGGILEDRRGEGVVDEHGHPGRRCDDRRDVDLAERRVLRSLEQDEPGIGPDRRRDRARLRPGDVDPEQAAREQVIGAPVERPQRDDVAPLLARGEQARGQRGHARCERDAVLGSLELGQPLLEASYGRVAEARVDRARRLGSTCCERVERSDRLVEIGQRIGAGEIDRRCVHAQGAEAVATGMNRDAVRVHATIVALRSLTYNVSPHYLRN